MTRNETITHPNFGRPYGCDDEHPSYHTPDNGYVWMWRKGQRVRFFDANGEQVGPELGNVAPALVYAGQQGWIDPSNPWLSIMVGREVRGEL